MSTAQPDAPKAAYTTETSEVQPAPSPAQPTALPTKPTPPTALRGAQKALYLRSFIVALVSIAIFAGGMVLHVVSTNTTTQYIGIGIAFVGVLVFFSSVLTLRRGKKGLVGARRYGYSGGMVGGRGYGYGGGGVGVYHASNAHADWQRQHNQHMQFMQQQHWHDERIRQDEFYMQQQNQQQQYYQQQQMNNW